jgi:putative endonuclease
MKIYVVYILSNKQRGTLYIGVTSDLKRRMIEHKKGLYEGFTKKYTLKKLVHIEKYACIYRAIEREKQLKRWHRPWKINLVEEFNPKWDDLYESTFGREESIDPEINSG